ncbi:DNA-binding transcriptional regulator, XRE-family HTH domain [Natronincola peptidivorans]|uniref:DNA-binding transcriptional regulator, XRE-family HTH domain n=1 Tax=Natronincola peptidivorans TaxID=426128 RepID=A0A1I0FS53_9FIRM|nr:helix-turn-helix transcriptional regulator [Natronincola peptidivorans]SET61146.1 DNA-binding transcriptional regulator, XRE-family HTH domain [Natronincola peptidivorans]
MQLGDKLRTLRKKQGLSQEDLAERLHVSRQSISKWESGQSTPEIQKILLLCDLFEISADALLRDQDSSSDNPSSIKNTQDPFLQWMKRHQRELAIILAFFFFVSIMLNMQARSTIQNYQWSTTWVRDRIYVSFFDELHRYQNHINDYFNQEDTLDPHDLKIQSDRMFQMANNHVGLDRGNKKGASSILIGISNSAQWVSDALEDQESLTTNELQRIQEFLLLLEEILLLEESYREKLRTHGENIKSTDTYEALYSKVMEMLLLTFLYGLEADQVRL